MTILYGLRLIKRCENYKSALGILSGSYYQYTNINDAHRTMISFNDNLCGCRVEAIELLPPPE